MRNKTNIIAPFSSLALRPLSSKALVRHFSLHKNLTSYYKTVMRIFCGLTGREYLPFNSCPEQFRISSSGYEVASLNNHFLSTESMPSDARCSLFIRDPRDLIVSGYFYHKKGTESWAKIRNPTPEDLSVVNGNAPSLLEEDESVCEFLQRVPIEEGLRAEMEFRKTHFEILRSWMREPPDLVMKYEDIIGNEKQAFRELGVFYGFNTVERSLLEMIAGKKSAKRYRTPHIRNPVPGQWREVFTPALTSLFRREYGSLLEECGYPEQ